jgi:hypothetical protein
MNTFGNLGGMLSPVVVGVALDAGQSFDVPLYTMAALYGFAALAWLAIDPTHPIPGALASEA